MRRILIFTLGLLVSVVASSVSFADRPAKAAARWTPVLKQELAAKDLALGNRVYLRIIKTDPDFDKGRLEAWVLSRDGQYELYKTYPICTWSGKLGPKRKQGDGQSPEGFYFVKPNAMNPTSSYHLSFNLGYPNAYDRAQGWTGDFLMVHGKCVSIGCYAMTDPVIEEIYTLMEAAYAGGQPLIRVHIFPYDMSDKSPNSAFDKNLKEGWDWFEKNRVPPNVEVVGKRYVFEALP